MSTQEFQPCYGAIPFRALRDRRLHGVPIVLLGVIAAHDRFGRNGQGCWASHGRLAELVGCRREAITHALGLLEKLEYVRSARAAEDGRRRTYHVTYNEDDAAAFNGRERTGARKVSAPKIGAAQRTDRATIGAPQRTNVPPIQTQEVCAVERTELPEICAPQRTNANGGNLSIALDNQGPDSVSQQAEYIPRRGNRYRKSSGSPTCNAMDGPVPDIDPFIPPEKTSLQLANERLITRHGRPNLSARRFDHVG